MKVGDLVVLSARGKDLQRNIAITIHHGGYGLLTQISDNSWGWRDTGDDVEVYTVHWFDKNGEFWRKRNFERHELKKKKRLNKS